MHENESRGMGVHGGLEMGMPLKLGTVCRNFYKVECFRQGKRVWVEEVPNIVVDQGLNDSLTQFFKGSSYTASFHVGLIDGQSFNALAASDTASGIALDHQGDNAWQEADDYNEANRQLLNLGSVANQAVDNSANKAAYSITGSRQIQGAFTVRADATKGGQTGTLYGAAEFSTPRAVQSGDTLNVQVTLTNSTT